MAKPTQLRLFSLSPDQRIRPRRVSDARNGDGAAVMDAQARIVAQDLDLQFLLPRAWLEAEFVDEVSARSVEGAHRVALSTAAVERQHQVGPTVFAQRRG
jgi:hypothetical protein